MPKQRGKNERDKTNPKNNRQREKKQTNKQTKFSVIISKFYSQEYNEVPMCRVAALLWGQIVSRSCSIFFCSKDASLFVGKTQFLSVARLYAVCSSIPCALATLDLRFSALPPVFMLVVIYAQL